MLKAPKKYIDTYSRGIGKDLSSLILHFISKSPNLDLHFIIDKEMLNIGQIIQNICLRQTSSSSDRFFLKKEFKIFYDDRIYIIKSTKSKFVLKEVTDKNPLNQTRINITNYIPLSNSTVKSVGIVKSRISSFEVLFSVKDKSDFYNNEKLLVVANQKIFDDISNKFPSCYVSRNEKEEIKIKYNSPLLSKITVLKNINMLDDYLEKEINGEEVVFKTCIFIGSSKFKYSITTIRKYYNQKKIENIIFIGKKDIKIDLGNNNIPLRWKWTIPEIKYLRNEQTTPHKFIIVENAKLENTIEKFYREVKEIEQQHTINLKSVYRFIRRLYFDWAFQQEANNKKLNQIYAEFERDLKELLEDIFFSIDPDYNFQEYQNNILRSFREIINAIRGENKTEKIKKYENKINQFVCPSVLCSSYDNELKDLLKRNKRSKDISLSELSLNMLQQKNLTAPEQDYYSLIGNQKKSRIVSIAKSDNVDKNLHKIVSSIYGSGKVEDLIERLAKAHTEYSLLLYEAEEKAFRFHIDKHIEGLNREYVSEDRYKISGVAFDDNYYSFTTFDDLIESLASEQQNDKELEYYKIIFTDNSYTKLPSSKEVLKIQEEEKKYGVTVEDLNIGDKVQIYENPDKVTLRTIFELKHPELIKDADKYSSLWQKSLIDYCTQNWLNEATLYRELTKNGFSVSVQRMKKYLRKEVMFPRRKLDLIAIAKTINNETLNFDIIRNKLLPCNRDYNGKMIEYGLQLSESINNFIISNEMDDFLSEWYTKEDVEKIVRQIPIRKIKTIELLTDNKTDE